jgi:hypothetical protein
MQLLLLISRPETGVMSKCFKIGAGIRCLFSKLVAGMHLKPGLARYFAGGGRGWLDAGCGCGDSPGRGANAKERAKAHSFWLCGKGRPDCAVGCGVLACCTGWCRLSGNNSANAAHIRGDTFEHFAGAIGDAANRTAICQNRSCHTDQNYTFCFFHLFCPFV